MCVCTYVSLSVLMCVSVCAHMYIPFYVHLYVFLSVCVWYILCVFQGYSPRVLLREPFLYSLNTGTPSNAGCSVKAERSKELTPTQTLLCVSSLLPNVFPPFWKIKAVLYKVSQFLKLPVDSSISW